MISSAELDECRTKSFSSTEKVIDLRDIQIDGSLAVPERVASFLEQVKNPYLFKVGDIFVKVNYKDKKDLSESLLTLLCDG